MEDYKICKCLGCRFPSHHTTQYHKCGTCKRFGHGQNECSMSRQGGISLIQELHNNDNNADVVFTL